jgi:hypothetical protein
VSPASPGVFSIYLQKDAPGTGTPEYTVRYSTDAGHSLESGIGAMHFYWDNGSGAPGTEIPGPDCFEDISTIVWKDGVTIHQGLFAFVSGSRNPAICTDFGSGDSHRGIIFFEKVNQ